ncbi:unnamed protein product [Albugo candida]|uniref:Uncharacterized protein n=1 Tax=Albugo candida TaxID=65357 RepID=A0A024GUC7_9STRA|nr:unnamed protein product [Albugo candida]|eukprot:CCI50404.1 unnamed protein product [Albugo candida]
MAILGQWNRTATVNDHTSFHSQINCGYNLPLNILLRATFAANTKSKCGLIAVNILLECRYRQQSVHHTYVDRIQFETRLRLDRWDQIKSTIHTSNLSVFSSFKYFAASSYTKYNRVSFNESASYVAKRFFETAQAFGPISHITIRSTQSCLAASRRTATSPPPTIRTFFSFTCANVGRCAIIF